MIKTVFFDVDGTLLSHTSKSVPDSTRKAIALLQEKNIQTVIATGRSKTRLQQLPVKDIAFDDYITLNGQLVLDRNFNIQDSIPISDRMMEKFISLFNKKEVPVLFLEEDGMYINYIDTYVEMAQRAISSPLPPVKEYSGNTVYQVIIYADPKRFEPYKDWFDDCTITRWNPYALDLIRKGGGKDAGIMRYLKAHNLQKDEVMAFGDGENDITMLDLVGTGIAMGNADEEVKKHADYVTTSVDEDGILLALKHFNVI